MKKQIQDPDIAKGELFTITKAEEKSGTRRTVKWLVTSDARAAVSASTNGNATSQRRTNGAAAPSTPASGNGHKPSFAGEPKGFLVTGQGQFLLQAFTAAVDCSPSRTIRCRCPNGASVHFRGRSRNWTEHLCARLEIGRPEDSIHLASGSEGADFRRTRPFAEGYTLSIVPVAPRCH